MLELATIDLLCEGKYAEMLSKLPQTKSDVVTWVWGCYFGGKFIGNQNLYD